MLDRLGTIGIIGLLLLVGGIGLIASESLVVAAGMALIVIGVGLIVKGLVSGMMRQFGFA